MTSRILISSVILILSTAAAGQDRTHYEALVKEGNGFFEHEQYSLAADIYREALSHNFSDASIDYRLAECYRKTFAYTEAEGYYLKVLYTEPGKYPLSLFYYALMLKLNGNLPESMLRFDQFVAYHEQNAALKEFVEQAVIERAGCEIAQQELGLPAMVKTDRVEGINSPFNDFAPAFRTPASLVITSSRVESNRTLIDERNGEAFTDNFYFTFEDGKWINHTRKEFSITNSLYHDGSGSFTKNGEQYFFTICEERCRIFETHLENNKWTKPVALDVAINDPLSNSKQPAISPGGDTLFFASNRAGGYGKFDIWMSINAGDHAWQQPINAGRYINTKGNDIAPALTPLSATLFFSSDGHPGYGGFDFFVAKGKSTGDTTLYNLGQPFNSVKDDCFITFNGQQIYWSSNREGGLGGFDIFGAHSVSAITLVSKLSLKNRNDSRMATLTSRTAQSENIHLLASRNEETIDYHNLTYERKSAVNRMVENRIQNRQSRREDFPELSAEEFEMLNQISYTRYQALMLKQKYASTLLAEVERSSESQGASSITGQLFDGKEGTVMRWARVLLTNENGEILKITHTNEEGYFRFTDVPPGTKLFLRLENLTGSVAQAFVKDIRMTGSDKNTTMYVENVYFDFDHYVIRPEAAQVLAELATYLQANPGAQVEIYAFADDRGSSAYNFELTQKRGEAVVAFLAGKGVDATSLAIIPKGKQQIRQGGNEIQRQYNRRAEFYINGVAGGFTPAIKTYILKKEADWNQISRLTGVPKENLKALNGSDTDIVKAFQPLRVPLEANVVSEELFFVGI